MKRWLALTGFAIVLAFGVACEDDPIDGDCICPPLAPQSYVELTTRSAVLNNLELSYMRGHTEKYAEVLDQNFTFYFYAGDVVRGAPAQWARQDEIDAHAHMFGSSYASGPLDDLLPLKKLSLDVRWEDGVQWQKITQDGGEEWFTAAVFYNFQFDIGENDHIINYPGAKAQFTVRNAGTESDPHWQLVEMRDLNQDLSASTSSGTNQATWGWMKYSYR